MATSIGEIIAQLGIQSTVDRDIAQAKMQMQTGLNGMSTAAMNTSKTLAAGLAVGATAAVGAAAIGVAAATKTYMDFESTVASAASVTGLSGQAFLDAKENIASLSKELGSTTTFKASEAANAMYDLASSGYDVANMTKSELKPILDIAAGTQSDLTTTTEIMTATMGQFGLSMSDSSEIADVFARTIGSSKATIDKLGTSMSYVGPVANNLGMSIQDTSAVLGVLYNSGLDASTAGTAMRGALTALIDPTSEAASTLESMGLTLDQVNPNTNEFTDILQNLADAGMTAEQAMAIFGVRAGPAMLTLTSQVGDVKELTDSLYDAGGAAQQMADQNLDTLKGSMDLLNSAVEGLALEVGGAAAPAIRILAQGLTALIPGVTKAVNFAIELGRAFAEYLAPSGESVKSIMSSLGVIFGDLAGDGDLLKAGLWAIAQAINVVTGYLADMMKFYEQHPLLVKFAVAAIAIGTALAVLPAIAAGVTAAIATVTTIVTGLAGAITAGATIAGAAITFLLSPIGLVVAAIALLAMAWYNNWFGIQDKTAAALEYIKGALNGAVEFIGAAITQAGDKLLFILGPIGAVIYAFKNWDQIGPMASEAFNGLNQVLQGAVQYIMNFVTNAGDKLLLLLGPIGAVIYAFRNWEQIGPIVSGALNNALVFATSILSQISGAFTSALNFLITIASTALNQLYTVFTTILNAILTADAAILNGLVSIFTSILSRVLTVASSILSRLASVFTSTIGAAVSAAGATISRLGSTISSEVSRIPSIITSYRSAFSHAGSAIISAMASAVTSRLRSLYNQVKSGMASIRRLLPSSPAKEGPFKKLPDFTTVINDPLEEATAEIGTTGASDMEQALGQVTGVIASTGVDLPTEELQVTASTGAATQPTATTTEAVPVTVEESATTDQTTQDSPTQTTATTAVLEQILAAFTATQDQASNTQATEDPTLTTQVATPTATATTAVSPTETTAGTETSATAKLLADIKDLLQQGTGGGDVNISDVKLDSGYTFEDLMKSIDKQRKMDRVRRGIR
jgi:TP901 family phage tail tape measure protein